MGTESATGIKRPQRDVDQLLPSNAEVKERVELYLYFPVDLHSLFKGELYVRLTSLVAWCSANIILIVSISIRIFITLSLKG